MRSVSCYYSLTTLNISSNQISLNWEGNATNVLKQIPRQIDIQQPFCSYQESMGFECVSK